MCISAVVANNISKGAADLIIGTGLGAVAGSIMNPIGAAGGALFGFTSYCVRKSWSELCSKIDPNCENRCLANALKIAKLALPIIASIGASMFVLSLVGIPLEIGSAVLLTKLSNPDLVQLALALLVIGIDTLKTLLADTIVPYLLSPCMSAADVREAERLREEAAKKEGNSLSLI